MRKLVFSLILILSILISVQSYAQSTDYYQRLYYTCKAWGYVKYFHSAMETCTIDWDSVLIASLPQVQAATNNQEFNDALYQMIIAPGGMAIPTTSPPVIPDSLFLNLDNSWFNDSILSDQVRNELDTIEARFRPHDNCYVQSAYVGNPDFSQDDGYYLASQYPELEIRLLALFRYWNDVEYFFPYSDIMDQDWDTTLVEMIPYFVNASDATEYALAILRIVHHINDTHGFTTSYWASMFFGDRYPRFFPLQAEGKMVVAYVDDYIDDIFPGDVVLMINGESVSDIKDSLRPFMAASNESRMQMNLNNTVVRGTAGEIDLLLQDETGTRFVSTPRQWGYNNYQQLSWNTGPVWYDTILPGGCNYGYVDMGRLAQGNVDDMFNELWNTDAIVFDIRTYPQGTLWTIVNYLYPEPLYIANFSQPDATYGGTISWHHETIGSPNPELYEGYVIILFNENTLSQSEYTCMGLELHPKSIKIGSQTAGADGNVSTIYLPGNIITMITGLGTFYPDYTPTQRIGIVPDFEVQRTIVGLREERDEVLEFAFSCDLTLITDQSSDMLQMKVFPNPSDRIVNIENPLLGDCDVYIINIQGQVCYSFSANSNIIVCDLEDIKPGLYIVKIENGSEMLVNRFIIE